MKKTLLITQHFPPHPGGAQNYYYQLCEHMPTEDIVVLADDAHNEQYSHLMRSFSYPVYYRPFYYARIWPKWLRLLKQVLQTARKENIEILWAGEPLPKGVVTLIVSALLHIPYYVTTHGADVLNPIRRSGLSGIWKKTLLKTVFKRASFVTANSEYTRSIITQLGITPDKVVVVYPAVQNTPPAPTEITDDVLKVVTERKQRGEKIILSVSRVVSRKGIDVVIEAMQDVCKEFPQTTYVVFGDGLYRETLEKKAKETGLSERILFTGALSDAALKQAYSLCDVFVMVPREEQGLIEGFGIVYLEAGGFGKPVIGSRIGGVPEAIVEYTGDNQDAATGLLVNNPQDSKEVAQKIIHLLTDPKLAHKLGEYGVQHASQFTWQKGIDNMSRHIA